MDILEFLDGGDQHHHSGGQVGIHPTHCVRAHSARDKDTGVVEGSGFCRACLAYLSGQTEEDPLEGKYWPTAPELPPHPPDGADWATWSEYMATASRSYT